MEKGENKMNMMKIQITTRKMKRSRMKAVKTTRMMAMNIFDTTTQYMHTLYTFKYITIILRS
jgi:hypothetical protein